MVATIRVLGLCLISLICLVSAQMNDKQAGAWIGAKSFLDEAHQLLSPAFRRPSDFTVQPTEREVEAAWGFAKTQDAGPIFSNRHTDSKRSIYILTKIPHGNDLLDRWGLNDDANPRNVFLFWRVKKDRLGNITHKLLATQVRPAGGILQQQQTLSSVINEVKQLPRRA